MTLVLGIGVVLFLTLLQTTLFTWQLAFAGLVLYHLFVEKLPNLNWLILVCLLVAIFGNLNPGVVIISLTAAFLIIEITCRFIPINRLTKSLLVILSLPLSELTLLTLFGLWH